jgi:hypothetical protein
MTQTDKKKSIQLAIAQSSKDVSDIYYELYKLSEISDKQKYDDTYLDSEKKIALLIKSIRKRNNPGGAPIGNNNAKKVSRTKIKKQQNEQKFNYDYTPNEEKEIVNKLSILDSYFGIKIERPEYLLPKLKERIEKKWLLSDFIEKTALCIKRDYNLKPAKELTKLFISSILKWDSTISNYSSWLKMKEKEKEEEKNPFQQEEEKKEIQALSKKYVATFNLNEKFMTIIREKTEKKAEEKAQEKAAVHYE